MLLVRMFSGLFGTRQPFGELFPGEGHPSRCFPQLLNSSLCRVEALWAFLIHFGVFVGVIFVHLTFV